MSFVLLCRCTATFQGNYFSGINLQADQWTSTLDHYITLHTYTSGWTFCKYKGVIGALKDRKSGVYFGCHWFCENRAVHTGKPVDCH